VACVVLRFEVVGVLGLCDWGEWGYEASIMFFFLYVIGWSVVSSMVVLAGLEGGGGVGEGGRCDG
jgi:hypothetical protein